MNLSLKETQIITQLADLLYDFLPGSGNQNTAFPLAAEKVGIGELWQAGSKRPAIVGLLSSVLTCNRHKITELLLEIVRQSLSWRRGKGNPLTKEELIELNRLLGILGFKIPELNDVGFLEGLPSVSVNTVAKPQEASVDFSLLQGKLMNLTNLDPRPRGFAFEEFLNLIFQAHKLAPRGAFRLVGEQIDGSFQFRNDCYLVEAKWLNKKVGNSDLLTFSGKVSGKAQWARGVYISYSGFSDDGLEAFLRGRQTNIVCIDGLDLFHVLSGKLNLTDVLEQKIRHAAETNNAFIPVRNLFGSVV